MREAIQSVWLRLSPLLDRALELGPEARHALVGEVRDTDPALADTLQLLLDEHERALGSGFLETGGAPLEGAYASAGRTIGGYTLVRPLGMGGMGTVWLAQRSDGRFEGHVAVKLVNFAVLDDVARERFRREGTLLARLSHPNIARLFDAGISDSGQPYLVLEHVAGTRIDHHAATATLEVTSRLLLFLQVADAVAHAHANLVVHRDLKPSNVLVDASGQAKLLDFGVATLVDDGATASPSTVTLAAGPALTPAHAAPEQAAGQAVTTATDVYALGVLLYQLLVGRHPTVPGVLASPAMMLRALAEAEPRRLSDVAAALRPDDADDGRVLAERSTTRDRLRRACRGDLDTICATALRKAPAERYQTVTAFADDVRRHLRNEPIAARPDSVAYKGWKFVQRHRVGVATAAVMLIGLLVGLFVVNRERENAERRFVQVRTLANRVLALDRSIRLLPGSTKARHEIVAVAKDYLEALLPDAGRDAELALEVGTAYFMLAQAQGLPGTPNLGLATDAAESLGRAETLLGVVLTATPTHQVALLRSADVAEARMQLADAARRDDDAFGHAKTVVDRLDTLLASGTATEAERLTVSLRFGNIALFHKNAEHYTAAIDYGRRGLAVVQSVDRADAPRAQLLSVMADAMRLMGDLDGAIEAIREARRAMTRVPAGTVNRLQIEFGILWREGVILGEDERVNLGRTDEAIAVLQQSFDLAEEWAVKDGANAASRLLLGTAARELGSLLRHRDARRALVVYDVALARLGEVKDSPRARRGEIELLAGSTYALRTLGRLPEAGQRLDDALARLEQLGAQTTNPVQLEAETDTAERAHAAHLADTGRFDAAIATYRKLLDDLTARVDPLATLTDACRVSRLYEALARVHRRAGDERAAAGFDGQREQLWRHWDGKLPDNTFVRAQLTPSRR